MKRALFAVSAVLVEVDAVCACVTVNAVYDDFNAVFLCFFAKREEACELSYRFSTPELFRISEGLDRAIERLQANANVRLTLTQLAIEIGMMS